MNLPENSPAAELISVLASIESLNTTPERQARILARVRGRVARPRGWRLLAFLRPATVAVVLLSLAVGAASATLGPRARWRWLHHNEAPGRPLDAPPPATVALVERPAEPDITPPPPRFRHTAHARAGADSPSRLMAAVHALRSEHQPVRAQRLALDYLRIYPRGALAEEALAVAIEAAAIDRDPKATHLAVGYLRQYPTGRFRELAERVRAPMP